MSRVLCIYIYCSYIYIYTVYSYILYISIYSIILTVTEGLQVATGKLSVMEISIKKIL